MRDYEIVHIFDAALSQDAVDARLEVFHTALGGRVTAVDHWGVRQLAYPIRKAATGYYVVVQVTADPAGLPEFERLVKLDEEAMRYLVVLNEGHPTSGASVLAERLQDARPQDDGGGEKDDAGSGDSAGGNDDDSAAAGEEDQAENAEKADAKKEVNDDQASPSGRRTATSGPPVFTGARGRRRRHEGPPVVLLNYKDVATLSRFLTEQGRILPKRTTKVTARFQRMLGTAVKRARHLALLPYVRDHGG